ncbi:MAG TPA: hypothetical protein VNF93_02315 [Buchnera sp. (in: enterobacteria)]|nr:hypothetical protein [Buchnera sp. (in: enterobacteria)]
MTWENYEIVGSYNNQRYPVIDSERTINQFEYIDSQNKKSKSLIFTSGLTNSEINFFPNTEGFRKSFVFKDSMYHVVGNEVYRIDNTFSFSHIGTISGNPNYVGIDANTFQIIFVDGINGWIYDTDVNLFEQITDSSFPAKPIDVCSLDGFFVVADGDTNNFKLSSFNNGLIWGVSTANFNATNGSPNLVLTSGSVLNYAIGTPVLFTIVVAPFSLSTTYYVVFNDGINTIRLSSAKGGAAINFTATGSGTITNLGQLQVGSITTHPGNIIACRTLYRKLFLFSSYYTEVWENQGIGTNLPFRRNNSLLMEYGTPSRASIITGFNKMFFLSQTQDGLGSVMEVVGTQPFPISNRALDFQLSQYAQNQLIGENDPLGILIKENGLIFYRLNFTDANKTFVYNESMSNPETEDGRRWHEEELLNGDRHPAQSHVYFQGNNYYGDYRFPALYIVDSNNCTNDGESIRRVRIGRAIGDPTYKRVRIDRYHLDLLQGQIVNSQFNLPFTADPTTDMITVESTIGLVTGSLVTLSSSYGQLPIPLAVNTNYYVILISLTNIRLATSYNNAIDNIYIDIVSTGFTPNTIKYTKIEDINPTVFLSYSKDGGQSYGNKLSSPMGAVGERSFRTVWRKLGVIPRGQYFVPKIEFFTQVPYIILGAAWVYEQLPE